MPRKRSEQQPRAVAPSGVSRGAGRRSGVLLVLSSPCLAARSASAAGGGGWPLSGDCRDPEARGGAQRAREGVPEAARPPAPAISESRCDLTSSGPAKGPGEPAASWCRGHLPHSRFDPSRLVVPQVPAMGLLDGLAADPERLPDLASRRAFSTRCGGQQIPRVCQRVLGVSHRFQGVQWALGASQGRGQFVERSAYPPPCVARLFGAHVNAYCDPAPTELLHLASTTVAAGICDTHFPNSLSMRVGSLLFDRSGFRYRLTTEKKRPRAVAAAGVVDDIRSN